jgi:hypothetical protein
MRLQEREREVKEVGCARNRPHREGGGGTESAYTGNAGHGHNTTTVVCEDVFVEAGDTLIISRFLR